MLRLAALLCVALAVMACADPNAPGCWYYTEFAMRTDTVWNTVPGGTPPFILVTREMPTDSINTCR